METFTTSSMMSPGKCSCPTPQRGGDMFFFFFFFFFFFDFGVGPVGIINFFSLFILKRIMDLDQLAQIHIIWRRVRVD